MDDYTDRKKPLGERLLAAGLLTSDQLAEALQHQKHQGARLGQVVVELGLAKPKDVARVLEEILSIPYVDVSEYPIAPEVVSLVPEWMIRRYCLLPLRLEDNTLEVAMVDPLNLAVVDDLKLLTGYRIAPRLAWEREILQAIDRYFDVRQHAEQAIRDIESERPTETEEELSISQLIDLAEASPTVRLVNSIIYGALSQRVSDIHLEPQETHYRIRYRVDGLLRDHLSIPLCHQAAIASRIKVMARLNIAERRRPQDGRIVITHNNKEYDLRISLMPTVLGEKIVIRVLDKSSIQRSFDRLGFLPDERELFEWFITRPYGMILVTGPTGSGKSTTLYSALNRINTPEKNIITIEDPVEYHLPGITQTAVNPKVGVTFASGLRTIVRQDPDVIMVGEIRDSETAEIAVQSALTGHLVFSTLHTNDAPGAIVRLMNMGVEPFLIASSVIGVLAQRLVRVVCSSCRELYEPTPAMLARLGINSEEMDGEPLWFARGKGCAACNRTGYRGRVAVYEVMKMSDTLRELTLARASSAALRDAAIAEGLRTMRDSGIRKVLQQITTPEEILRVIYVDAE
ncbi:MAG: ATPase, T2SS/T4P/T4SS family [Abditibacteriales bacterium]|nr:ATPase, T2SS/T4P/T4SS family [Abditibacteriales bacterium]MDW8364970.1 ATPase, T2SS/T4P/T4SS family [Abditibacteriales bacterium]